MNQLIHVSIGEVKTGKGDDVLQASLGSCVGIALLWPSHSIYGLAHCLLPVGPIISHQISARFVSDAVPSLIKLMAIHSEDLVEVEAVVAGGGNMTAPPNIDPMTLVGHLNWKAAEEYLNSAGIRISKVDVGANNGRKIKIFCKTGEVIIEKIPRLSTAATG